jgi:hypothetical protein
VYALIMNSESRFWHKNLNHLPPISFSDVEKFRSQTVPSTSKRAYKFFLESYIHEFEGERQEYM